jgi:hypothetical protein
MGYPVDNSKDQWDVAEERAPSRTAGEIEVARGEAVKALMRMEAAR